MAIIRYNNLGTRNVYTLGAVRSPWVGLESEIDRLFESATSGLNGGSGIQFPVDIYEDKDNTFVRAELPGVIKDDINVEMVDDHLTITAVRKQKTGEEEQSCSVSRSVTVPEHVQADKVSAAYENGILTVTLPKQEEAKPKKISVAVK